MIRCSGRKWSDVDDYKFFEGLFTVMLNEMSASGEEVMRVHDF